MRIDRDIAVNDAIDDNVCTYFDGTFGSTRSFDCPSMAGCYLTVQRVNQLVEETDSPLTLCEVTVYGEGR